MKMKSAVCLGSLGVFLFGPAQVFAQELGPEDAVSPEIMRPTEVDETEVEVEAPVVRPQWDFRLTSEIHSSDNAGFRELDEGRGLQEQRETDDRHTFGYTSVSAGVTYKVLEDTTFRMSAGHSGLWGSNQLGGTDAFGNFFTVYDLNVNWAAITSPSFSLDFRLGRQDYRIGGATRDFFLRDYIDGLVIVADLGFAGRLRLMPVDLYASMGRPDTVHFLNWHAGRNLVQNMRGQTNTVRFGGVYENTALVPGLEVRGFGFYASMSGAGTGGDRSHEGTLANIADNDFAWMAGTRVGYFLQTETMRLGGYGEYAYSGGMDRKEVNIGLNDVTIDGNAFGVGALGEFLAGPMQLEANLQFFRADGPTYDANGVRESHGFVSFRGHYAGGLNQGRYAGWRPSAYLGRNGIYSSEHDHRRSSGTQVVHAGFGVGLVDVLKVDLGLWHFQDTGVTRLNPADVDVLGDRAPMGITRDDLIAQSRLGRNLGTELNANLTFFANSALSFYTGGGVFMPGEFYEIEVSRAAGTARGSADNLQNFWAIAGGATLAF
jgi:hypothetical protein